MALFPCPECKREVSSAAPACPHCGFPNPATAAPVPPQPVAPSGPACYACAAPATTRCVKCGALSCAVHVQNIFVQGNAGGNELRCQKCYADAQTWNGCIWAYVIIVFIVMVFVMIGIFTSGPFNR